MKLKIKIKTNRKMLTIVLVISLVFVLLAFLIASIGAPAQQQRITIAAWQPSTKPGDITPQRTSEYAAGNQEAALTRSNEAVIMGGAGGTKKDGPQYSYYSRGWNADNQWWQLSEISTNGYENIEISFMTKGSDTGPKNFALEYSTDGTEWQPLTNSSNAPITYTIAADNKFHQHGPYALPTEINDIGRLYVRFINTDAKSIVGGPTKSAGTNYISDITITGTSMG